MPGCQQTPSEPQGDLVGAQPGPGPHLRAAEDRHGEIEAAPLTAREGSHRDPRAVPEADQAKRFGNRPGRTECPGPHPAGLRHGQMRREPALLQHDPHPAPDQGRSRQGSQPSTRTAPWAGGASPSSSSIVEVFPAPLVPSNAKSSPRRTEKVTPRAAHDKPHSPPGRRTRPLSPAPHNDRENAGAAGRGQQRKHPLPKRRDQRVWTGRRNHRRTQRPRPPRPPRPRPRDRGGSPLPGRAVPSTRS